MKSKIYQIVLDLLLMAVGWNILSMVSQLDEEQHVDGFEPDCFYREEITPQDLILVVP